MEVIDLNGYAIEVTDLDEAIKITAEYKEYQQEGNGFSDFNERQKNLLVGYARKINGN